jgi:1-acyl-sn-glycerol-3-phosphate acyltransferase
MPHADKGVEPLAQASAPTAARAGPPALDSTHAGTGEDPVLRPNPCAAGLSSWQTAREHPAHSLVAPAASHLHLLRQLILDEVVVKVVGLPATGWARRPIDWLLQIPAQRFAELGAGFDLHLAHGGFAEAARWVLPRFVHDWQAYGTEHVPLQGPLLVVANHPGAYDVLVIAANLPRDDLKVVAGSISFLQSFAAADRGLIFAGRDYHMRATALRSAVRHLDAGGTLLTFPSETLDPDPERAPVSPDELERWSPSIEWTLRHVPQTSVLVAIVSGVITRACYHHPLTLLRKRAADRRRMAALIQMAGQLFCGRAAPVVPKVSFSAPVTVPGRGTREDMRHAMQAVLDRARHTLDQTLRVSENP